jgi:hypothetical protein
MEEEVVDLDDETIGLYLGFPNCCVKSYIATDNEDFLKVYTDAQKEIHGWRRGFIPCPRHAEKVVNREISLESLIQNRHPDLPLFRKRFSIEEAKKMITEIIKKEKQRR